jgi:uncharacterized protein (UPF0210 family)
MSNISIEARLVDGSVMPIIDSGDSCLRAVERISGDDVSPPVQHVVVEVLTASGKAVRVVIPKSATATAIVQIDGNTI